MGIGHVDRLRIYLGDERHIYKGSHQMRRRGALADLELIADDLAVAMRRIEKLEVPISDFINKVNTGRAHSIDSYGKFLAVMMPLPDTGGPS